MPAPALRKPNGRLSPLMAVRERPTARTRQRSITADYGPYLRRTPAEKLADLRRRLASTENKETIRRILGDASELASVAPESLLGDLADFTDRVHSKLDHLAPAAPRTVSERRLAAAVHATDRNAAPAISMRISTWTIDEFGNRSRVVYRADEPVPP
jgi:hypothetical protein